MEEKSLGILPATVGSNSGLVSVLTSPSPLRQARVETFAEVGQTVAEMLCAAGYPYGNDAYHSIVLIDGEEISETDALIYRPTEGEYIVASIVPHGGKTGKLILSILIGILMIATGIGGLIVAGGPSLLGGLTAGAAIIGGLATVLGAVISYMAPPPQQPFSGDIPSSQASRAITGTRNDARPYDVIPSVLGRYRMFPAYLAKPYTEVAANQQFIRLLFTFGYGPLEITDLKIGDTTFDDYGLVEGVDYNILDGFTDDDELSIFTDEVDELPLSWVLTEVNEGTDALPPPHGYGEYGGQSTQGRFTTSPNVVESSIDITFPGGLIAFRDVDALPVDVTVFFLIEFREFGVDEEEAWTPIDNSGTFVENDASAGLVTDTHETGLTYYSRSDQWGGVSFTNPDGGTPGEWGANIKMNNKIQGLLTLGVHWKFPSVGQYDVRIRRTNTVINDSRNRGDVGYQGEGEDTNYLAVRESSRVYDSTWTRLRSIKSYTGVTIPNLCKLEMKIQSTDRLHGMLDTVNGVAQSWVNKYDNTNGWGSGTLMSDDKNISLFLTRNPAWVYAHVLRGQQNSRPPSDDMIDTSAIVQWATDCETGGDELGGAGNVRTFDAVVDFPVTVRKLLDDIAGSSRASFNILDGKYSVLVDKAKPNVMQHFTPRNSSGFSGSKSFRRQPHAMRVSFINPDETIGYKPDEVIVYADGYSKAGNRSVHLGFRGSLTPTNLVSGGAGAVNAWYPRVATTSASGGALRFVSTGTGSGLRMGSSPTGYLALDTTSVDPLFPPPKYVRMKIRRVNAGGDSWSGRLYFATGSAVFEWANRHDITEPEWEEGWVTVVWDMSQPTSGTWLGGTIDRLRFDLFSGTSFGTTFEIESIQIDDGTQEATEFAAMDLWGQTDPDQAMRDGRYHMASHRLRPEIYTLEVDVEHLAVTRGDKIRVTHDVMAVGYGAARLTEITLNGSSEFISGKMDESFNYLPDKTYQVHIRKRDGEEISVQLSTLSGERNEIAVSKDSSGVDIPVAITGMALAEGDLVLFGESGKNSGEYLIHSITPKQDLAATLTLVDYNEAVYDPGTLPPFVSNTTTQQLPEIAEPPPPAIISVISDETVMTFTGGIPRPRVLINLSVTGGEGNQVPATHIAVEFSEVNSSGSALSGWRRSPVIEVSGAQVEVSLYDLSVGGLFNIRARTFSVDNNTSSAWIAWGNNPHEFVGGSALPEDVQRTRVTRDYVLQWDYPNAPNDLKGFIVKYQGGTDSTWSTGALAHEGFISTTNFRLKGIIPYGQSTIMIKAVDWFGNESENAIATTVNIEQDNRENVIATVDFAAQVAGSGPYWVDASPSWVTVTDGTVSGTEVIGNVAGSAVYWINPDRSFWSADASTIFWDDVYLDMEVEFEAVTHHAVNIPCRVMIDITTEGDSYQTEFSQAEYFDNLTISPLSIQGVFPDYSLWPGELTMSQSPPNLYGVPGGGQEAINGPYSIMSWKVKIVGGRTRPKLKTAVMYVDAPILEEVFSDQEITQPNSATGLRLIPTVDFKKITSVQVTVREGTAAQFARVDDVDEFNAGTEDGPLIKLYTWLNYTQAGTFDAVIRGY